MEDHTERSKDGLAHPYGVELFGPLALEPAYDVLVDGRRLPYLRLHPVTNDPEGEWSLVLDNRFMIVGTDLEMRKWIRFLTDAMAVSAGYVCFGSDKRINPHNPGHVIGLSVTEVDQINDEPDANKG